MVVWGGADETAFSNDTRYFADLWALDLESTSWTQLDTGAGQAPNGRFWSQFVYDTEFRQYALFGGHDVGPTGNRNDTWLFDPEGSGWFRQYQGDLYNAPANGFCDFPPDFVRVDTTQPERRSSHTMVWSEGCGHALIFGGKTDCGAVDDVWSFRDGVWTERTEATEGELCHRWRANPDNCVSMCL
jgi:hypothetical protein